MVLRSGWRQARTADGAEEYSTGNQREREERNLRERERGISRVQVGVRSFVKQHRHHGSSLSF